MTNYNACEQEHGDPLGFLREVAAASAEGHETGQLERPFGFGKVLGLEVRQPFPDMTVLAQPTRYRPELRLPLN